MPLIAMTQTTVFSFAAVPVIYFGLVALGRGLKRRAGVRLGIVYQLFCICAAVFVPMTCLAQENLVDAFWLKLSGAAVAMLGTLFLIALINRFVWEFYFQEKRGTPIPKFMTEVIGLGLFLIALLSVLTYIFDQRIPGLLPGLLTGSGILAVIIGFAMRETLSNMISGFSLHFQKPFQTGDWLVVDKYHGEVIEINWRSTRLRTNDNIILDIPNSHMASSTIINLTFITRLHAMRLQVGIDYKAPPNRVKEALLRATLGATGVLSKPSPKVFFNHYGESSITYEIKFWFEDHAHYNDITDAIRTNIWYELQRRKIKMPFPIRTLQIERTPRALPEDSRATARQALRQQRLFQCLDDARIDSLLPRASQLHYGRGEKIIEQGADGESMFILVAGDANVEVDNNGETASVAVLRTGDCFGEMSLLTGEKRSATVIAANDCEVVEIDKTGLAAVLKERPELMTTLSELLAKRRMENEGILAEAASRHVAMTRQQEYATTFLAKLKSYFEL
jgi:small-conductance mechanosensitive channel